MKCPRCLSALNEVDIKEGNFSIKVDQCTSCKGAWFDAGELNMIENIVEPVFLETRKIPSKYDQLTPLDCPYCDLHPMMEKAQHPRDEEVIMDYCDTCGGVWLDAGELEAIQRENWWTSLYNLIKKMS